jgi:hypothetical protein
MADTEVDIPMDDAADDAGDDAGAASEVGYRTPGGPLDPCRSALFVLLVVFAVVVFVRESVHAI